jgi:hypothetical protein
MSGMKRGFAVGIFAGVACAALVIGLATSFGPGAPTLSTASNGSFSYGLSTAKSATTGTRTMVSTTTESTGGVTQGNAPQTPAASATNTSAGYSTPFLSSISSLASAQIALPGTGAAAWSWFAILPVAAALVIGLGVYRASQVKDDVPKRDAS